MKLREDTISDTDRTIPGLGPAPHERVEPEDDAVKTRRCIDALCLAIVRRKGTDLLDQLLLDARGELEPGRDWSDPERQMARRRAERLYGGRP